LLGGVMKNISRRKTTEAHAALLRMLYRSLEAVEWRAFVRFHRRIRFDGESFEQLHTSELETLSAYADRARE